MPGAGHSHAQKKIHETPAQSQQQRTKKPEKTKSVEVQMSELATKKQVYDNPMNKNEVIKGGTGELSLDIKSDGEHLNAQQWDRYLDANTNQWYRVNKLTGELGRKIKLVLYSRYNCVLICSA